jgi:bifunctional non-homologous end joining protein LigD
MATAKKKSPAKSKSASAAKAATKSSRTTQSKKTSAADAVDEQLARYRSMRDFNVTAEPSGSAKSSKKSAALPFVIQKHAASHLHYDFRLGWNGVLKSWAVAKGPSYFPGDRRLAVQVEDHPMEYGGFEGIIPKGQYGGGTVMVWDQGTWSPQPGFEDVTAALKDGSLKFEMHGTKMKGKWTLVRMKGASWGSNAKPNWLLIKEHDDYERGKDDPYITDEKPDSAVTHRSLEQIAEQEDHVWNSKATAKPGQAWQRQPSKAGLSKSLPRKKSVILSEASRPHREAKPKDLPPIPSQNKRSPLSAPNVSKLPKERQPTFVQPELALEAAHPPDGAGWLHELKLDGYRIQARKTGSKVQLLTRKGLDWTHRMPALAKAIAQLPVHDVTFDGEVVVLNANGTTSFANLQASFQEGAKHTLTYFLFDLLHLSGRNTRDLPLRERKALLAKLLPANTDNLRYSDHIETGGAAMFKKACQLDAEGIISKRADAAYTGTRSSAWLKCKCLHEQEFVIGGYSYSSEGRELIGSLLLGYYKDGKLIYAGRTGTGFTQKLRRDLRKQLHAIERKSPAFDSIPIDARRDAVWVEPKFVAQVRFATWTADNLVRQAAFLGLREDKPAREVRREAATVAPKAKAVYRTSSALAAKSAPEPKRSRTPKPPGPSTLDPEPLPPLRLTHPDKILDPESGLTKQQLADYYWAIASRMLPHITGRPLSLVRCPEGAGKPCFFQKHVTSMLPPGIDSVDVPDKKTGKPEPYITLSTPQALAGLAQMGVLEVHPWGSTNDDLEHPDRLIFDLDPDAAIDWPTLAAAAVEVRKRLKKAGLESFLKTTGGKGLHVVAPIEPTLSWTELKDAAHTFVLAMERDNPALYLTKMTKSARTNKIYLDYLRNERGATAVAPFSPRARLGAHVSLPLPWSALKLPEHPVFSVHDFAQWKAQLRTDPWKSLLTTHQTLKPAAFEKL